MNLSNVYAQQESKSKSSEEIERACLSCIIELEFQRRQVAILKEQDADRDTIVKAQSEQIATLKQIIGYLESALKKGDAASGLDAQAIAELRAQVESFKLELQRVRSERDAAQRRGNRKMLVGLIIGAMFTWLASR